MSSELNNVARRMPNLGALRAFEAVFRRGGLAGAAEELSVTTSAISHQVRQLETDMGVKLVRRQGRRIVLTEAGERLFPSLRDAFGALSAAVADVYEKETAAPLRISMLQNFAVNWFLPRLERFRAAHPSIDVKLSFEPHFVDFSRDDIDLGVRISTHSWANLHCEPLFQDLLMPVCSRAYFNAHGPFESPECLFEHQLLTSNGRPSDAWAEWFASCGISWEGRMQKIHLDTTQLALQAAANGIGFAICGIRMMQLIMQRGELVAPFAATTPERGTYQIVCPKGWENRPKIRRMRQWLAREVEMQFHA